MKLWPFIAATCFVAIGATTWSIASSRDDNEDFPMAAMLTQHRTQMLNHLSQMLSLTDRQKQQIDLILASEHTIMQPALAELRQNAITLHSIDNQAAIDQPQLHTLAANTADKAITVAIELQKAKSKIYAVLDQNQRNKADEHISAMMRKIDQHVANGPAHSGRLFDMIAHKLDLTDQQKQQIAQIRQTRQQAMHESIVQLLSDWKGMQSITKNGVYNESAVTAQAQKIKEPLTALIENGVQTKHNIMQVLTPEQRQQAEQIHNSIRWKIAQMIRSWHNHNDGNTEDNSFLDN